MLLRGRLGLIRGILVLLSCILVPKRRRIASVSGILVPIRGQRVLRANLHCNCPRRPRNKHSICPETLQVLTLNVMSPKPFEPECTLYADWNWGVRCAKVIPNHNTDLESDMLQSCYPKCPTP